MKIRITFDLDDRARKAIAHQTGAGGRRLATYEQCKRAIEGLATADLQVIVSEFDAWVESDECENCGCAEHLPKKCATCECIWGRA